MTTTTAAGPSGAELLALAYDAVVDVLTGVDEPASWQPTGCRGWAVRDLACHVLGDMRRALVALHSPATSEVPDRDAVTYWTDWAPDEAGARNGRRHVRVEASMFLVWEQLRDVVVGTARAVVHAGGSAGEGPVRTQGHVLLVDDLLRTLAVEATIHHLDLVTDLPDASGPTTAGLAEVRRVLDGLVAGLVPRLDGGPDGGMVGGAVEVGWSDERYARVATGRSEPSASERSRLGPVVDRFPLFS